MEYQFSPSQFDGVRATSRRVPGFLLSEIIYSPNIIVHSHWHEQANFCIAIQGGCTEVYGSKAREYRPLNSVFLPSGESHSLSIPRKGVRAFSIEVDPSWLERAREYSLILDSSMYAGGGVLSGLLLKLYNEFKRMDEASPLAIEGLAMELFAEVSRNQARVKDRNAPRWLEKAREILHERFSDHLRLETISREVGVHPVHLAREFRRHYCYTVGEYTRKLRVERACLELSSTNAKLLDIALAAGFSDQGHFTRVFKRHTGMTPAEYREEFRAR
jgi:AraC family transcriptional regulator